MLPDTHETGCGGRDRRPTHSRLDGDASREDCRNWTRAELALARRAAREDWGVPDEIRGRRVAAVIPGGQD